MRYESKDFIQSHRQWRESRESKKIIDGTATEIYSSRSIDKIISRFDKGNYRQNCPPKEDLVTYPGNIDARKGVQSNQIQGEDYSYKTSPKDLSPPADFSKRELEQLVRRRQRQRQQKSSDFEAKVTTNMASCEKHSNDIRRQSLEILLATRNNVKQSYRERSLEAPVELDSFFLSILPNQMWFGDFFRESEGALEKIHKRTFLD